MREGGSWSPGPRISSASVRRRLACRFTNHGPSSTSPSVLTPCADTTPRASTTRGLSLKTLPRISSTTLNWRRLASSTLNGGGSFSSGSSGKNFCAHSGTPASASISGHTFKRNRKLIANLASPHIAEGPHAAHTLAAHCGFHPHDHRVPRSESQPDSTRVLELMEVQLGSLVGNLSHLKKQRGMRIRRYIPSMLRRSVE